MDSSYTPRQLVVAAFELVRLAEDMVDMHCYNLAVIHERQASALAKEAMELEADGYALPWTPGPVDMTAS